MLSLANCFIYPGWDPDINGPIWGAQTPLAPQCFGSIPRTNNYSFGSAGLPESISQPTPVRSWKTCSYGKVWYRRDQLTSRKLSKSTWQGQEQRIVRWERSPKERTPKATDHGIGQRVWGTKLKGIVWHSAPQPTDWRHCTVKLQVTQEMKRFWRWHGKQITMLLRVGSLQVLLTTPQVGEHSSLSPFTKLKSLHLIPLHFFLGGEGGGVMGRAAGLYGNKHLWLEKLGSGVGQF